MSRLKVLPDYWARMEAADKKAALRHKVQAYVDEIEAARACVKCGWWHDKRADCLPPRQGYPKELARG